MKRLLTAWVLALSLLCARQLEAADVWVYWLTPKISTDYSKLKRT